MAGPEAGRTAAQDHVHVAGLNAGGKLMAGLVRHLTPPQAAKLAAGRHRQALRSGRILLYRDHIPYVSFLVLEGSVGFELGRGTRLARSVTLAAPLLIGEHHVAHRKAFPMTVRVLDKVVMCVLCCPAAAAAPHRPVVEHGATSAHPRRVARSAAAKS